MSTEFEVEFLDRGIELINSRPHHPQTNSKLKRVHRSIEEIECWDTLSKYVAYYNERRLHLSLDIKNLQMPLKAFFDKKSCQNNKAKQPQLDGGGRTQ